MIRRAPRSTRTGTLFPYTTRFRSLPLCPVAGNFVDFTEYASGPALLKACAQNHCSVNVSGEIGRRFLAMAANRSEEHTSELKALMRIAYAVFWLQRKTQTRQQLQYQI